MLLQATARLRSEGKLPHHGATTPLGAVDPYLPYDHRNRPTIDSDFQMVALPRTMRSVPYVDAPGFPPGTVDPVPYTYYSNDWWMSFLGDIEIRYSPIGGIARTLVTRIRQDHVHGGVILPNNMPAGWGMPGGLKGFWIMEPIVDGFPVGYGQHTFQDWKHCTAMRFDTGHTPYWDFRAQNVFSNVQIRPKFNHHSTVWRLTYFIQFAHPTNVVGHIIPHNIELAGGESSRRTGRSDTSPRLLVDDGAQSRVEEVEDPQLPLHNIFLERIHHWQLYGYQMEFGWDYHVTTNDLSLASSHPYPDFGQYKYDRDRQILQTQVHVNWSGEFRVRS